MPAVRTAVEVPGETIEHAWDVVSGFESYPAVMPNVLEVRFLERAGSQAISAWRILLDGIELTWEERDTFEPLRRIRFEQVDGDLEMFRGAWLLTEIGGGVRVELSVEFDLGIPSLAAVLDPIAVRAIESNSHSMLAAISSHLPTLRSAS
jgi:ribosome-associated toxin RatA of RatAB toxin-antitoxin module